jgi:DNA processing protein
LAWLAFGRVRGLGCIGFRRIADFFADPTDAFLDGRGALREVPGLSRAARDGLSAFSGWDALAEEMRRVRQAGVRLVRYTDPAYPERLRATGDPPPVLYTKGSPDVAGHAAVGVVGTRAPSEYGREMTRLLCRGLSAAGITVVSGMARGIDGEAHEAALAQGGRTVAVLGSAVDVPYPPEHGDLSRRIQGQGAVLSEYPMGTAPLPHHFPSRNRIISGLSLGVVVVEATERSGSLITARSALEQGREVFAVPGPAGASRSRGPHRLIREGAKLVEGVADIIEEIAPQLAAEPPASAPVDAGGSVAHVVPPDGPMAAIQRNLEAGPLPIDDVIQRTGLAPPQAYRVLLEMELQGLLR